MTLLDSAYLESNDLSEFAATSIPAGVTLAASSTVARTGTYSLQYTGDETGFSNENTYARLNWTYPASDIVYVQFGLYIPSGNGTSNAGAASDISNHVFEVSSSGGGEILRIARGAQNTSQDQLELWYITQSGTNTQLGATQQAGTQFSTGAWVMHRVMIDKSGANPVLTWWMDTGSGYSQIGTVTDSSSGSSGLALDAARAEFGFLFNGSNWQNTNFTWYFDDIEIHDSDPDAGGTTQALAGVIAGTGTSSGTLDYTAALAGPIAGAGALSGSAALGLDLAGSVDGAATVAGLLSVGKLLSGSIDGAGSLAGLLALSLPLSGEIAGVGSLSGALGIGVDIAGGIAGAGGLVGDLSIGGGSLTVYPETSDAYLYTSDATYTAARAGTGTFGGPLDPGTYVIGQTLLAGPDYRVYEAFLNFDVSGVPSGATVDTASLSLYLLNDFSTTDFTIEARSQDWGDTVETGDWVAGADLSGKTLLASIGTSGIGSTGEYKALTSEAALASAIESAVAGDGILRLILCSSRTVNGDAPTTTEWVQVSSSAATGTSQDPKLDISYSFDQGALAGAFGGSSSLSGLLGLGLSVSGSIDGISALSGALTIVGLQDLSGSVDGSSDVSGLLGIGHLLSGSIDGVSDVVGVLSLGLPLSGTVSATGSLSGVIDVVLQLAGVIAGSSDLSGVLTLEKLLAGVIAGSGAFSGSITLDVQLAGSIAGSGILVGTISREAIAGGFIISWVEDRYSVAIVDEDGYVVSWEEDRYTVKFDA